VTSYVVTLVMFCRVFRRAQVSIKVKGLLLAEACSSTAWGVQSSNIPVQELYVDVWVRFAAYRDNKIGWRGVTTSKAHVYTRLHEDSEPKKAGKGGKSP